MDELELVEAEPVVGAEVAVVLSPCRRLSRQCPLPNEQPLSRRAPATMASVPSRPSAKPSSWPADGPACCSRMALRDSGETPTGRKTRRDSAQQLASPSHCRLFAHTTAGAVQWSCETQVISEASAFIFGSDTPLCGSAPSARGSEERSGDRRTSLRARVPAISARWGSRRKQPNVDQAQPIRHVSQVATTVGQLAEAVSPCCRT